MEEEITAGVLAIIEEVIDIPTISLHALAGQHCPRTLRMIGVIQGMDVQVLIDGGSTHNFIKKGWQGYCSQLPLKLTDQQFLVDFYVLNLGGACTILGVQWLELLEELSWTTRNYMEFQWHGKTVKLQGEPLLQC
ncbi:hypothetical protein Pint_21550 [Pistacia integerrima]|uniref:Uncharacterized protein n=1 Tax=Pistacia integerrima TaxID=434235 RepID=A0ACC0XCY9_9ROSI|nr:hypothetical protein Pint_21550 [Pistacia integerrima]